jgi:hypothetical protein
MSGSEWSHLILAVACLVVGVIVILPLMPLIGLTAFAFGVAMIGLYLLVRLWPSAGREDPDGPEEDE